MLSFGASVVLGQGNLPLVSQRGVAIHQCDIVQGDIVAVGDGIGVNDSITYGRRSFICCLEETDLPLCLDHGR